MSSTAYCCNENSVSHSILRTKTKKKERGKTGTATPGLTSASSSFKSLMNFTWSKAVQADQQSITVTLPNWFVSNIPPLEEDASLVQPI